MLMYYILTIVRREGRGGVGIMLKKLTFIKQCLVSSNKRVKSYNYSGILNIENKSLVIERLRQFTHALTHIC